MTPDQLLTFATVADAGNISRAAQQLHLCLLYTSRCV